MKSLLIILIVAAYSYAADYTLTYYQLGGYENSLKKEVGTKEAKQLIFKAKKDRYVRSAIKKLNVRIKSVDGKPNHPDYFKVLDSLKKSNSIYGKLIGLDLYIFLRNKYPEVKYAKKYGYSFADALIEKNLCTGYLMKGDFIEKAGNTKGEQYNIWKRGLYSNCKGSKFAKFWLTARKNDEK